MTHVLLIVQVCDGEVERERHQGRAAGCSGGGREMPTEPTLCSVRLSVGQPSGVSSSIGEGYPPTKWAVSPGRGSQTLALTGALRTRMKYCIIEVNASSRKKKYLTLWFAKITNAQPLFLMFLFFNPNYFYDIHLFRDFFKFA